MRPVYVAGAILYVGGFSPGETLGSQVMTAQVGQLPSPLFCFYMVSEQGLAAMVMVAEIAAGRCTSLVVWRRKGKSRSAIGGSGFGATGEKMRDRGNNQQLAMVLEKLMELLATKTSNGVGSSGVVAQHINMQ